MTPALLRIEALSYTYPGADAPALEDISFSLAPGECLCLTGHTGCGKTSLLLAIKGLLRGGCLSGTVALRAAVDGPAWSLPIGIVFQNPESQILCSTVAEEVAFGPENLCVPPDEIARRVAGALRAVGLDGCENRNVERFSAGQKQRLAIASVLSLQPSLLLLDEPTSQLDRQGKERLAGLLAGLKRRGYALILAEHDPRPFSALIDRCLAMEGGRIVAAPSPAPPGTPRPAEAAPSRAGHGSSQAAIRVQGASLSYPETGAALRGVSLEVRQGERVHLHGENGAGKSTLLRCLAGLERPDTGVVELAGVGAPQPERLTGRVGVLFQNPVRQLFAESVHEEVAFSLRRLGYPRRETETMVAGALDQCAIAHLAARAPLTLSFGEQHRVALAAVLAPRPGLLLLDEPFAGLDWPQRQSLLALLKEVSDRGDVTILIASHDELPVADWADRTFLLKGGTLAEAAR